eukprot:7390306-Prymnesium_polylepis.1
MAALLRALCPLSVAPAPLTVGCRRLLSETSGRRCCSRRRRWACRWACRLARGRAARAAAAASAAWAAWAAWATWAG